MSELDLKLKETVLSAEDVFTGKVVHLQKWKVRLPNGKEAAREVVLHIGAAAVVPVDGEGNITLVRQHRVAVDTLTWEIPAGKLDFKGEDPLLCAKRELSEETGLVAENWRPLAHVITTPGFCTEKIGLYLATGLSQHEAHCDADEFLQLKRMRLSDAYAMAMRGEFPDMKTCLGIIMAYNILRDERFQPTAQPYQGRPRSLRAGFSQ